MKKPNGHTALHQLYGEIMDEKKATFDQWCKKNYPNMLDWDVLRQDIWNYFHQKSSEGEAEKALIAKGGESAPGLDPSGRRKTG